MGAVAWANLRAHPVRLLATALSVVLGIAFVAGTFILTDTIQAAFDDLFEVDSDLDVVVRPLAPFGDESASQEPGFEEPGIGVPPDVVDRIADVDGVAAVEPSYSGFAQLVRPDGQPLGGQGPPTFGQDRPTLDALDDLEVTGRYPEAAGEVAIDAGAAEQLGAEVGDTVSVVVDGPVEEAELVGIVDREAGFGGVTFVLLDDETAAQLYGQDGASEVSVLGEEGVEADELRQRVAAALDGERYDAVTGSAAAQENQADLDTALGFFTTGLLVFAGVSLLVGAIIIANTFTIIVAQRTRELALVRAIGAGRRQVLTSILLEALAVGLVGSAVGLVVGFALAAGLEALLSAVGAELPTQDLVLAPRTVVVSLVLGVVITVLSAVAPAVRATRVAPVEALRSVAAPPRPTASRLRLLLGVLLLVAGVATLAVGLFAGAGIVAVGGGALLVLLAVAFLGAVVAGPLARVLGAPVAALRGLPGTLARENASRNPRRTASTAAALMIGLGLVSFVLIFAASLRASVDQLLDEQFLADYQVSSINFGSYPTDVTRAVADVDGVAAADGAALATVGVDGTARDALVFDPSALGTTIGMDASDGDYRELDAGSVLVADDVAQELSLGAGDQIEVAFSPDSGARSLRVAAVYDPDSLGFASAPFVLDRAAYEEEVGELPELATFVRLGERAGEGVGERAGAGSVRGDLEAALEPYPQVQLADIEDIRDQVSQGTTQLLSLVFGLLGLSIVIALLGITNTLALSVLERTRELGLLRAVGMDRSQTRVMVRWEAVIVAVLGALLGLAVGVLFGWLGVTALADEGFEVFALPAGQLAIAVLAAGVAGVLAAILPARRASRIDVLRALQVE